jgi:DnaD/phage-associated family protein
MAFTGFSTDGLIGLPPEFFTQVLPSITLASELKVTLHIFYRLNKQRGSPRRIGWDELAEDRVLRQGLRALSSVRSTHELLDEGLEAAVRRATLLHLVQPGDGRLLNWYLVNTPANARWVEQMSHATTALLPNPPAPEQRTSVLTLYEQNIGLITPMIVDELREAEERYPIEWIEEAMREAVRTNARSWRYIRKVLERWATYGRQDATDQSERHRPIDVEKYTDGRFGGLFRSGGDDSNH